MKITDYHRAEIVESDPLAVQQLTSLHARVRRGEITPQKADRIRRSIEGRALQRLQSGLAALESQLSSS